MTVGYQDSYKDPFLHSLLTGKKMAGRFGGLRIAGAQRETGGVSIGTVLGNSEFDGDPILDSPLSTCNFDLEPRVGIQGPSRGYQVSRNGKIVVEIPMLEILSFGPYFMESPTSSSSLIWLRKTVHYAWLH